MSKEYCKNCGQVLQVKKTFLSRFTGEEPSYHEFKDGYYCIPCTKAKLKNLRGE